MENNFTVLYDYDSMIYKGVHHIATFSDIRKWFKDGRSRKWINTEIVNLSINRITQMVDGVLMEIEDTGVYVGGVEYFLTVCPNSKRKKEVATYKAKRKRNKWVSMVRAALIEMDAFIIHDEWEADDLIKDRAVELGEDNYIICSPDKDLKQIPGIHFDYYRPRLLNPDKTPQLDENGYRKVAPCRGLSIVDGKEANYFYWIQMLMGDSGDGIKGIPRVGKMKAKKILKTSSFYHMVVIREYVKHFGQKKGVKEFKKHQLLIGLGVKHRPENK